MKKVISFSLFGSNPKYLNGAVRNAFEYSKLFKDWQCWFYIGETVPTSTILALKSVGVRIIRMTYPENYTSTIWRFHAFLEGENSVVLVRDVDSLPSIRELTAVNAWLNSDASLHIMRDHPSHTAYMLAGMWGGKTCSVEPYLHMLLEPNFYQKVENKYGIDQEILEKSIYHYLKKNALIHDSFSCLSKNSLPFPCPRDGDHFIGEVYETNGVLNQEHISRLRRYENSSVLRFKLRLWSRLKKFRDE